MTVTIHNGDALDVLAAMPDQSVDAVVTDPPYGETSLKWDKRVQDWPAAVRRVLKRTGSMWVFGSTRMFMEQASAFAGWKMSHDVVWEKHNGSGLSNDRFRRVHEMALHFYRDDAKWSDIYKETQYTMDATARVMRRKAKQPAHFGAAGPANYKTEEGGPRLQRSVIYCRSENGRAIHPTQKPENIIEPLLRYACSPGGVVLDPFAGSGTTGVVAERLGRDAVLVEINPDYARMAYDRVVAACDPLAWVELL